MANIMASEAAAKIRLVVEDKLEEFPFIKSVYVLTVSIYLVTNCDVREIDTLSMTNKKKYFNA